MFVSCVRREGSGHYDGLVTRCEESYRLYVKYEPEQRDGRCHSGAVVPQQRTENPHDLGLEFTVTLCSYGITKQSYYYFLY